MRKFSVAVGATALALAGAGCGSAVVHDHEDDGDRCARRRGLWAGPVNAPSARSIVGTWSGYVTPFPGSGASRRRFMIVVARGERRGTWRIGLRCAGTLRLEDISSGYHHYYRVGGASAGARHSASTASSVSAHRWSTCSSLARDRTTASTCVASAEGDRNRLPRSGMPQLRSRCWFDLRLTGPESRATATSCRGVFADCIIFGASALRPDWPPVSGLPLVNGLAHRSTPDRDGLTPAQQPAR